MNNKKFISAAFFLVLGMVLPMITMQIKEIGDSLLPMHLTVMLCGFVCGYKYGGIVGFIMPLLRGIIFGMPLLYPNGIWMAFELCTYGTVAGFLYPINKRKGLLWTELVIIISMILGRLVWAACKTVLLGLAGKSFTVAMFVAEGFTDAIPGIILQLVLIPVIMKIIKRSS